MTEAVIALIFSGDKIIGVSRKDDPNAFGLIGGKVEKGENHAHALYREVEEETGLRLIHGKKIFSDFDGNMQTTTYLCEAEGQIQTTEKGVVKEVTWEELFAGPFGEYNRKVYNTLQNGQR
jgi:8-oxo-dGTP pyrophosphatase MutT (NUDIX family)